MYNEEDGLFIDSSNNNDIVASFHSSNTTLSWHTEDDFSKGFVITNHSNTMTFGIMNNNIIEPSIIINSNTNIFKDVGFAFRLTFLNKCDERPIYISRIQT